MTGELDEFMSKNKELEKECDKVLQQNIKLCNLLCIAVASMLAFGSIKAYHAWPKYFNTAARVDCLENGGHDWEYVRFSDTHYKFQCKHCYKITNELAETVDQSQLQAWSRDTGAQRLSELMSERKKQYEETKGTQDGK